MPKSHVQFSGSESVTTGCTQLIGDTITLTGNSGFHLACAGTGTRPIRINEKIVLTE